ncbi:CU044_5270 family protein [Micromonospora sp. WMMD1076]|uniref:CU044_5270 family protein n=1 Tax=Micromonospora sp. WMMD1076 TaxID=3016103 RepID=UPI00249AB647|nr:CU044_5270 family protein [Micromonospora sp. WMMD1076]WFF08059.1 CU044_5270 family protein [Micromonospora sp. WMMD1076]
MNDQQMIDRVRTLLGPADPPPHLRTTVQQLIAETARPARTWSWKITTVAAAAVVGALALLGSSVTSIGGRPPAASAEAAEILRQAAAVARADGTAAPRPDQFILTTTKGFAPAGRAGEPQTTLTRSWASVDGTRDGLLWVSHPRAGGRQSTVIPGCRDGRAAEWAADGSLKTSTRACTPDPAYLNGLPTDAAKMLTYLKALSVGNASDNEQTFANVGVLIRRGYLPARSRAALYEAAAKIPGVIASSPLTDAAGRSGVAVSLIGAIDRYDLIFEPGTYRFLGWQVMPKAGNTTPQGRREVILSVSIVDAAGQTT